LQEQKVEFLKMFFDPGITTDLFASHRPRWNLNKTIRLFYSDDVSSSLTNRERDVDLKDLIPETFGRWDAMTRAQYLEMMMLLPGYILSSQADRPNMANAIEGRYPFLDFRVVHFALGLSGAEKMPALREKHLLRLCAAGLLPKEVLARVKQPYRAPEAHLFFQKPVEYVEQMLSPAEVSRLRIFKPNAVDGIVRKFRNGSAIGARDSMLLTGILSTQLLCQYFCCGDAT
jgi:asparagine synthase (glutamine-hydrolysing)